MACDFVKRVGAESGGIEPHPPRSGPFRRMTRFHARREASRNRKAGSSPARLLNRSKNGRVDTCRCLHFGAEPKSCQRANDRAESGGIEPHSPFDETRQVSTAVAHQSDSLSTSRRLRSARYYAPLLSLSNCRMALIFAANNGSPTNRKAGSSPAPSEPSVTAPLDALIVRTFEPRTSRSNF